MFAKNFKGLLVVAVLATLAFSACSKKTAVDGEEFVSEDGGFSVVFPGEPTEDVQVEPSPVGDITITLFSYDVDDNNGYAVMYMDFPADLIAGSDPKVLLEGGLQGQLGSLGSDLVVDEQKDIELDGNPGLYAKAYAGDLYAVTKDYLVGNRAYVVMMVNEGGYPSAEEEAAFIESFKLLK